MPLSHPAAKAVSLVSLCLCGPGSGHDWVWPAGHWHSGHARTLSSPFQMGNYAQKGHVTHSQWLVGLGVRHSYPQAVFCVLHPHVLQVQQQQPCWGDLSGRDWGGGNVGPGGQGLEAAPDLMPEERWEWV